jgi:hypothetical protein
VSGEAGLCGVRETKGCQQRRGTTSAPGGEEVGQLEGKEKKNEVQVQGAEGGGGRVVLAGGLGSWELGGWGAGERWY